MGLTREQWHSKRIEELKEYVKKYGRKVKDIIYWDTYPVCVKDICVSGVSLFNDEISFVDYEDGKFKIRKEGKNVERKYLEEVLEDMKKIDKNKNNDKVCQVGMIDFSKRSRKSGMKK